MASSPINTITIGSLAVFDPPEGSLQSNYMAMHTGAARFGVGQFLMKRADYNTLAAAGFPVLLDMRSGVTAAEQTHQTVQIEVIVAGYRTCSWGLDSAGSPSSAQDMVWATVYDLRCEKASPLTKAYNVQKADLTTFYDATLDASTEFSWAEVITDLDLTDAWPGAPDTWNPRNLVYDGVPFTQIVDDIAARLHLVVSFDYTDVEADVEDQLIGLLPGAITGGISTSNATIWAAGWIQKYALPATGMSDGARSTRRKPAAYQFVFPCVVTDEADPFTNRAYTKTIAATGSGATRVVHVGEYPAIRSGGAWTNSSTLDAVAAYLKTRMDQEMACTPGAQVYGGLWPLIPDGEIRGILWRSDVSGATTTVHRGDDRDFNPVENLLRQGRDAANQLITAYADGRAAQASNGGKYVVSSPSPSLRAILVQLAQDGGGDGGSTTTGTAPTWTYTVKDYDTGVTLKLSGTTDATTMTPIKPRLPYRAAAAYAGLACRDSTGTLILIEAFESYSAKACGT